MSVKAPQVAPVDVTATSLKLLGCLQNEIEMIAGGFDIFTSAELSHCGTPWIIGVVVMQ